MAPLVRQQRPKIQNLLVSSITILLVISTISKVETRQYSKCEFAQEIRRYFPDEEIAAWTCIAQYESEFKTDALNPSNADGSSDHGVFQINDRYWCGSKTGTNTCGVECDILRRDDISASVRCAQIVRDKQGFTAWAVWPKCKGHIVSYLDDCDRSILRSAPPTVFDIQVRPANRGPGFNRTRVTSSLKSFQLKDIRGPAYDLGFNDTRNFNLTSIGAMGFLGASQWRNFSFGGLRNYLVNRPTQDIRAANISLLLEDPVEIIVPPRYQPSLTRFGGMNFLGGTDYRPKLSVSTTNALSYQPSGLTRFGGMNFLGANTIPDAKQGRLQSRAYGLGILQKAGIMGFLGGVTIKPNSLSFNLGSELPSPTPIQRSQLAQRRTSLSVSSRPYSAFDTMGFLGAQYGPTPAPVKGLIFRSGPGLLASQGAMNFLGGIGGISFPSRTTSAPRIRPLQHLAEGSLLRQIPSKPGLSNTFVYRQSEGGNTFSTPRKFTAERPLAKNLDVSNYLISFQGTGSTIRFGSPGQINLGTLSSSSLGAPPQSVLSTSNRNRSPVLPPARPAPILATSRVSPAALSPPAVARVRSQASLTSTRSTFFDYKPKPLNIQSSSFQRPGSIQVNRALPSTPLSISQPNGPAMSYSTGTTFFSIGSLASSSPAPSKSPTSPISYGVYRAPTRTRAQAGISQRTSSFGGLRSLTANRPAYQSPIVTFNIGNSQPFYEAPSLSPSSANTLIRGTTRLYNSPSEQTAESGYQRSLKDHRKRVSYGYQPYATTSSAFSGKSLEDINRQGLQFPSQISFTTPTAQFTIGGTSPAFASSKQLSSLVGSRSVGQSPTSAGVFSRTVRSSPTAESDIPTDSDAGLAPIYPGILEPVRQHMPPGYGGISYMLTNGVMTMVKHYG